MLQALEIKKSQRSKRNEDGLESEIRLENRHIKSSKRLLRSRQKGLKDRMKAQK